MYDSINADNSVKYVGFSSEIDSVEIVESLDSISKSLGEEMTLKCRFKPPAVSVHWERNQVVLEQDEATIITSNGISTLYVNKLNFYHMAEYRCIGTFFSSVGEAATTVAIKGLTPIKGVNKTMGILTPPFEYTH